MLGGKYKSEKITANAHVYLVNVYLNAIGILETIIFT